MSHMNNGRKERLDAQDLEDALSSITAQMYGMELGSEMHGGKKDAFHTLRRELQAFRAGRIVASLKILFPERYKDENGKPTLEADYVASQLREFRGLQNMLSYKLGQFVGRLIPHTKGYPAT